MTLYHGSSEAIQKPDISFARETTDFGKGFYTTTIKDHAQKWAARNKRRRGSGIVSVYEADEIEIRQKSSVLEFKTYSDEWLDFIVQCRQGQVADAWDLVIGGIANDDVFNTLTLYFGRYIDKPEAIKRLRYEKPNIQYCFKTQSVIDEFLTYKGHTAL